MRTIFFLCTGNYFRSRFAEELFNSYARHKGLAWKADSGALDIGQGSMNVGPMSSHTLKGLCLRGIEPQNSGRMPRQAHDGDFSGADIIICLNESEHRPLIEQKFPAWASKTRYWRVNDVCGAPDEPLLAEMEKNVLNLLDELALAPPVSVPRCFAPQP